MPELIIQNLKLKDWSKKLSFKVKSNNLGLVFRSTNRIQLNDLINICTGKKIKFKGQLVINNIDLSTASRTERSLVNIKSYPLILRLVPLRWLLTRKLFFNLNFLFDAHNSYLQKKYNKDFIRQTTPNLKLTYLYLEVDKILQNFIKEIIKLINHKLNLQNNIIKKQIISFWSGLEYMHKSNSWLQKKIVCFFKSKFNYLLAQEKLTMLQGLSDVVNNFRNIYYQTVKLNESKSELAEKRQMFLLIRNKHLRILKTKIIFQQLITSKQKRNMKVHFKQLLSNISNYFIRQDFKWTLYYDQLGNLEVNKNWNIIYQKWWKQMLEMRTEFMIEFLNQKKDQLNELIVQKIAEFKIEKVKNFCYMAPPKIEPPVSVLLQAFKRVKHLLEVLNIKINWFKLTKQLSSFDLIIVEIINAYFYQNKILLINNLVHKLTRREAGTIKSLLTKLRQLGWDFFLLNFEIANQRPWPQLCDKYLAIESILKLP